MWKQFSAINHCSLSHEKTEFWVQLNTGSTLFYLLLIFLLDEYIRDKHLVFPRSWRSILSWWFAGLAVYSGIVSMALTPTAYQWLRYGCGWCKPPPSSSSSRITDWREDQGVCFWTLTFYLSKIVEFGDTLVLLLMNRRIILLQWYHHVATLWYVFYAMFRRSYTSFWFTYINVWVHTIMYAYFFQQSHPSMIRTFLVPPKIITMAQILQMVIGVGLLSGDTLVCTKEDRKAFSEKIGLWLMTGSDVYGMAMYIAFFFLFVRFYRTRYPQKQK